MADDELSRLMRLSAHMTNFWRTAHVLCLQAFEGHSAQQDEQVAEIAAELTDRFHGHKRSVVATVLYLALMAYIEQSLQGKALAKWVLEMPLPDDWERIRACVAESTRGERDVETRNEIVTGIAMINETLKPYGDDIALPVFMLALLDTASQGGDVWLMKDSSSN